ncbi:hypothetical protein DW322_07325 [Rhodococcus rhodnii]|uniref:Uncharacterized protein n=3 Tax=Rhodococcus rhodnii TaxID=38312 RepID=R7WN89_9NOCA|nr:hypothetical protein Rrhod_1875 [Rhodococcus rhodnii LMG 5362]TXG90062.1 hypothetical protein DW322_07325 [Rhodococcus rhodnii]
MLWYVWFALVVLGVVGVIASLDSGDPGGVVFALVWTAGFGYCLHRHQRKVAAAAAGEIAARADREHQAYLPGEQDPRQHHRPQSPLG